MHPWGKHTVIGLVLWIGVSTAHAQNNGMSILPAVPRVYHQMIVAFEDRLLPVWEEPGFKVLQGALESSDLGALYGLPNVHLISFGQLLSLRKALAAVRVYPGVRYVDINVRFNAMDVEPPQDETEGDDPDLPNQWALENTGDRYDKNKKLLFRGLLGFDIGIKNVWDHVPGSKTAAEHVRVAILDTGIDLTHPDLDGNLWKNPGEIAGNRIDDDNNGLVDDYQGWNFVNHGTNADDNNWHGTFEAGIIGARHNRSGIAGINDRVTMIPIKVLDRDGSGSLASVAEGLMYAQSLGAQVILAAWGGAGDSNLLREVLTSVTGRGALVVAAASNWDLDLDTTGFYPASYSQEIPGVISVAAAEPAGNLSPYSAYGNKSVDILAPGHRVLSTLSGKKNLFASGTSMASGVVAGSAALLLGEHPEWGENSQALKMRLVRSAEDARSSVAWAVKSHGLLRVDHALFGVFQNRSRPLHWEATVPVSVGVPHDFKAGSQWERELSYPGAKWLRIRFKRYSMVRGLDRIEIYSGDGALRSTLTGYDLASPQHSVVSEAIPGDTAKIVFITQPGLGTRDLDIIGFDYSMDESAAEPLDGVRP